VRQPLLSRALPRRAADRLRRAFIDEIAHPRAHPTIPDRTVIDCFQEECVRLLPLPDTPFATDTVVSVVADKTAFVRSRLSAALEELPTRSARCPCRTR
jgi:hypothetical protein